ncbi:MAG TPA: hypothetical protein VL201_01440 [Patescibacteria group bacterium]|nr:hypothetical protein [Patescibacteria group bacterium]
MKITIKNILLLLQAIFLLAGNQVLAMHENPEIARAIKTRARSAESIKAEEEAEERAQRTHTPPVGQNFNIPVPPQPPVVIVKKKLSDELDREIKNNALLNRHKNAVKKNAKKEKQDNLKSVQTQLNGFEKELETVDIALKNTTIENYKKTDLMKKKVVLEGLIKKRQEEVHRLSPSYKERLEDLYDRVSPYSQAVANKTVGAANYVQNSSFIKNPLVNTITALWNTLYNTAAGTAQQVENNMNQTLDLFGPNLQYNIIEPCAQAQEKYECISLNDLGKFVLDNTDFQSEDKKIRSIQAVIEQLVIQSKIDAVTMNNAKIKACINSSLVQYTPIKQLLEKALSTSLTSGCSLIDALKTLKAEDRTLNNVQKHMHSCTQLLEKRFAEWKDQAQLVAANEADKKIAADKMQKKLHLYDTVLVMLKEATIMYGCVFLIHAQLESLAGIDTTTVDQAIVVYRKYIKTLNDCKKAKEELEEDDAALLVKNQVMNGKVKKDADLIIKMKSLCKNNTSRFNSRTRGAEIVDVSSEDTIINAHLLKVVDLVYNYINKTALLLEGTECVAMTPYTVDAPIEAYLKKYETILQSYCDKLTVAQQEHIQSILDDIYKEAHLMQAMIHQSLLYQDQRTISDIKQLYLKLENDKKTYKRPVTSDKMQDISLEMLTTNRSEGIAELLKTHKSVSKMISWAEKQQIAYGDRQQKRQEVLHKMYDNLYASKKIGNAIQELTNTLVHGDITVTDQDLEKFDDILVDFMQYVEHESVRFTTEHRAFIETIAQDAIEDAKQNVKVHIVAGWTVLGVKAKIAFEELANTKGYSAKAVAQRALGKALDTVRQGLIGTGNAIAAENYHEETREQVAAAAGTVAKAVAENVAKGAKKAAKLAKMGKRAVEEALKNDRVKPFKNMKFPKYEYNFDGKVPFFTTDHSKNNVEEFPMQDASSWRRDYNDGDDAEFVEENI